MPSRNEPCPCASGRRYKRCCLERLGIVARELRERDELLDDVIAWLEDEHRQTLLEAGSETTLIRVLRGATGRTMSLVWSLNDYLPPDGGPPLMARFAALPELTPSARATACGLAEARLDVYSVVSGMPGLWLELESLTNRMKVRLAWRGGWERLETGDVLVARIVHATAMATAWGLVSSWPVDTERRWIARLASLPADPAAAALGMLCFHPDDAAEPLPEGKELRTLTWSIDDDEAVLEALEDEDLWESLGQALPSGCAFAWPEDPAAGGTDLGGWKETDDQIEVARLIVDEREILLVSADHETLIELSTHLQGSLLCDLIRPHIDTLAA